MDESRGNPDKILRKLQAEEAAQHRGQLKIFFGYAAGVGKTYAMLEAAQAAREQGVDLVVGYVEPHSRPATMALLEGLEQLPCRSVPYRGILLREFDLDLAIERKPKLILVDELAHSNAQGSRHAKRYQDIAELLTAGIDVYTTINVQHIESLNDVVASITGIDVRERIPDHIFDQADQVELVDIEPEELLGRLNAGKIYRPDQAQKAMDHFFDRNNLIALREIALRRCADHVNKAAEKKRTRPGDAYFTDEHILVCLSSSPSNSKIIRTAARMASAFNGRFTALFVETPDFAVMSEENKHRLRQNIHLAEQFDAQIETVFGNDIPLQIAEFSRVSSVSKIVIGRNNASRKYLWSKPSLVERLTSAAPNLDIYIIPDKDAPRYHAIKAKQERFQFALSDLLKSLSMLLLASLLGFAFDRLGFSEANIITVYILSVLMTAILTTKRSYSLLFSLLSVLTFNFLFTEPRFSLDAYDAGYPVTFLIMFVSAFLTSTLAAKLRRHAKQSAATAYRTKILLETNQLLQKEKGQQEIVAVTAYQLTKLLEKDIIFYLAQESILAPPLLFAAQEQEPPADCISANEQAVATWVFKNNKHAGATTNTLGDAKCLYLAVRAEATVYGVVGIVMEEQCLDAFENSILLSILGECALALENERVIREREEAAILAKNEQLRANLLRSISHDLRTPLTSISGSAGVLLSSHTALSAERCMQLYSDIYDDALWLINLVENLLSVTRLEDGSLHLHRTAELMDEVIEEALRHLSRKATEHSIRVLKSDDYLLVRIDVRLVVQVLINILENAIKYTPPCSEITISTSRQKDYLLIELADNGNGISAEAKEHIFEMFYTANETVADSRRGMGLGLALCKSIITAHGGEIWVADKSPHGTIFRFTLPIQEVTLHEP